METSKCKLVTVHTEAVLEATISKVLIELGASGYSISNSRGSGHHGVRDAEWSTSGNIRIEVLCGEELADKIIEHLTETYYKDYAMVLYETDVNVVRPKKF